MKKNTAAAILFVTFAASTQAATITLFSSAATANNSGSATRVITPHPAWGAAAPGASWISVANTGDPSSPGYVMLENGTSVTFSQIFELPAQPTAGNLLVMSDDTTSVILNGSLVRTAAPLSALAAACVSQPIGCITAQQGNISFVELGPHLKVGNNTLAFGVSQLGSSSYGLTYSGSITYSDAIQSTDLPEPSTYLLCTAGLLVGAAHYRRVRSARSRE